MGRDDDAADAPRRSSNSNGNKRTASGAPPPPGGGRTYDPTMTMAPPPASHRHPQHSVYASDGHYSGTPSYAPHGNEYQLHHQLHHAMQYHTDEPASLPPGSATNKRKRVKKERDDDWAPPPPPPMAYASSTNDMAMHMAGPTILHRAGSSSNVSVPVSSSQAPYDATYTSHAHSSSSAHTVFSEAPVVIESFAETERRRAHAATATASGGGDLSQLIHADQTTASATSTPKTSSSSNGASAWGSRAGASGTMSVFDVFFPAPVRTKEAASSSRNGVRESKRRRRNNGDVTDRSSTRSSNRRNAGVPDDSLDVDMLRFTVDSFKLIPQGLVDRIDARLRPGVVATLIASHVENWIKRAGFDDQNFLQEITTLLNVYYPCTHAMILDEVLVGFVFKRPELMEQMSQSIIERLQKTGESANAVKFPVIESFARRCGLAQRGQLRKNDVARHDLACLTVLRLLLERNTEKFMLSPWIASCASFCSDEVLGLMWEALLRPLVSNRKAPAVSWDVREPLDQVFELLREEKQHSRSVEGGSCKLSMALILKLVEDESFADLKRAPVACEAFEIFFGRSSNGAPLIEAWLATEERKSVSREDALINVMGVMIDNCARLSVKKTNWFIRHLLGFVSNTPSSRILEDLILQHAGLLLGGVDKHEIDELQGLLSSELMPNGSESREGTSKIIIIGKISPNEKHAEAGVVAQIGRFLDSLRRLPGNSGTSIVRTWSEKWCAQDVLVPWSYVWGVVSSSIAIEISAGVATPPLDVAFQAFACRLVKHYVTGLLSRVDAARNLSRIMRLLKTTIQHTKNTSAASHVECLLEPLSTLPKGTPLAEKAHNALALTLAGIISCSEEAGKASSVRSTVDKPLILGKPQQRIELLRLLGTLVSRNDALGRFARDQLVRRRRLGTIILQVLHDGDETEASAAVKIMMSAARSGANGETASKFQGLWTPSAFETVVALGYRVQLPATRHDAISLLDTISHSDNTCNRSLLWTVLKFCTNYCCGCASASRAGRHIRSSQRPAEAAAAFADLTKFVLKRVPRDEMAEVGNFIHQYIRSCSAKKAQWNLFLVLVLDRVVQLGWSLVAAAPNLVHLILTPFEAVQHPLELEDRIVQLRALKSFCIVLLTESSSHQSRSKQTSWLPVARILVSDQSASKLKWFGLQSACPTSAALVHSIVNLCDDIKQHVEGINRSSGMEQSRLLV